MWSQAVHALWDGERALADCSVVQDARVSIDEYVRTHRLAGACSGGSANLVSDSALALSSPGVGGTSGYRRYGIYSFQHEPAINPPSCGPTFMAVQ